MKEEKKKISADDYFLITSVWYNGKTSSRPCRGYNLKSWLKFEASLMYVISTTYIETTKEVFDSHWNTGLKECTSPSTAVTKSKATKKAVASKPKKSVKAVKKQSATSASVKAVKKSTKAGTVSSTTKKKKPSGSKATKKVASKSTLL